MECQVCMERIQGNRKKVQCPYCNYECCSRCIESYLCSETVIDSHCMNCRQQWNVQVLSQLLTKSFRNGDLKKHQENVLFAHEKSLLPETQLQLEKEQRKKEIQIEINELQHQIALRRRKMADLDRVPKEQEVLRDPIRSCPSNSSSNNNGCIGFLDSKGNCHVCNTRVCMKCFDVLKKDEIYEYEQHLPSTSTTRIHVCLEDNLKAVEMIQKETKRCPHCGVATYKIEGCYQMWCVQCHNAWDWTTGGKLNRRRIHNPHYTEYLESQRKNNQSNQERIISLPDKIHLIFHLVGRGLPQNQMNEITEIHGKLHHFRTDTMWQYRQIRPIDNSDLRRNYLKNKITEKEFKVQLYRKQKKFNKDTEISQILHSFNTISSDLMQDLMGCNKLKEINNCILELSRLIQCTNDELSKLGKIYGGVVVRI